MFRFLRFEASGLSAILWGLLFVTPYLDLPALIKFDAPSILITLFSSVLVAAPIGNYIHQASDTLLNPFRKNRLYLYPRAVIDEIVKLAEKKNLDEMKDKTFQSITTISKVVDRKAYIYNSKGGTISEEYSLNSSIIREEINNRYSYYYARIENGLVAPILGFAFSKLFLSLTENLSIFCPEPKSWDIWIILTAIAFGFVLIYRIPQLFRELDDLEVQLVRSQQPYWGNVLREK